VRGQILTEAPRPAQHDLAPLDGLGHAIRVCGRVGLERARDAKGSDGDMPAPPWLQSGCAMVALNV